MITIELICEVCGTSNPPGTEFCTNCNSYLPWDRSAQAKPSGQPRQEQENQEQENQEQFREEQSMRVPLRREEIERQLEAQSMQVPLRRDDIERQLEAQKRAQMDEIMAEADELHKFLETFEHRSRLRRQPKTVLYEPKWGTDRFSELCSGLFWEARMSNEREKRLASTWTALHYFVGLLGVVLAAIAGFGGLADLFGMQATSVIALAAGVVTGVATFLQSGLKLQQHTERASAWDSFGDSVTTIYQTRPDTPEVAQGRSYDWQSMINALQDRATALRANHADPHTPPQRWPDASTRDRL